ncbi:MAG: CinA family protein [Opitutaceae bacterium]
MKPAVVAVDLKALILREPRLTLAVGESLTCGQVQACVGAVSGASEFFVGGITTYTLDQKVWQLGVNRDAASRVNSVSAEIAEQMARGACSLFGSNLGLATTGYAEPAPNHGVTDPFAWWALAHRRRERFVAVRNGRVDCPGKSRTDVQVMVAEAALAGLVDYLRELRG